MLQHIASENACIQKLPHLSFSFPLIWPTREFTASFILDALLTPFNTC